jgi:hypothetical protein
VPETNTNANLPVHTESPMTNASFKHNPNSMIPEMLQDALDRQ